MGRVRGTGAARRGSSVARRTARRPEAVPIRHGFGWHAACIASLEGDTCSMVTRRFLLRTVSGLAGLAIVPAMGKTVPQFSPASLRGAFDAGENGLLPGTVDDQSKALQRLIDKAAAENTPLFIPPGVYNVSNLTLPDNARLSGVPGATRLVYSGNGHLLIAENRKRIVLSNLVLDGANRALGDYVRGLVQARNVDDLTVENCEIAGSGKSGIAGERCGGRLSGNAISGAAEAGIFAVESHDLSIADNRVFDCGNGGILVHRWQAGADGTLVTGNRVARIRADDGGTGQNGNGINVFRANGVTVANNHVADCAFSAIRSNAGSNVMMSGNQCLRSGETAIYSEFAFEGAMIAGNIVDGAANGISVTNFSEGGRLATVANNLVRNLSLTGPYVPEDGTFGTGIGVEADTAVTGNVVDSAPKFGLAIGWGRYMRNVTATGNIVRKARIGAAVSVVEGVGPAIIADNVFQETSAGAVVGFEWTKAVSGDLTAGGADRYAHLTVERNRTG